MTKRLFFGVELPEGVRTSISKIVPKSVRGLRWVPHRNLHLTMRFLGDVGSEMEEKIVASMGGVAVERFTLPLEGAGAFPPRGRAKVLWIGVGHGHPSLFQLRQQLDDRLLALGLDCDLRDFHPHVTVARVDHGGEGSARKVLKRLEGFEGPVFRVDALSLFESQLSSEGARYQVLERFRF